MIADGPAAVSVLCQASVMPTPPSTPTVVGATADPLGSGRGDEVVGGTPVITLIESSGAVREVRLGLIETYCAVFLYAEYL